jgi:hypothetical protein
MTWTLDDLPPRMRAQAQAQLLRGAERGEEGSGPTQLGESPEAVIRPLSAHKYGAVATERDGQRFDSKAEARRYDELKLLQASGEVSFFLRQVPFHLPGGVTYRADYLIFWTAGVVTIEDVKGYETSEFKAKKRMVEALYPVEIEVRK